jgi:type II secretory ATPase GspE/PulE/Tfp pilus assembly ATPase PilB-like protein
MNRLHKNNSVQTADKKGSKAHDAVSVVNEFLAKAAESGASDVHFEPTGKGLVVKFRLDGVLSTIEELPNGLAENIVARLKVMAGLLTYRNDVPQEGRMELRSASGTELIDRRVAIFPTIHGQRAVVRMFYEEPALSELDQLGFGENILPALKSIAAANQGVLLLTGPAGSGKSTTLGAILRHIVSTFPGKSIVALEDPVERRIANVTQVQISPHGAMDFATALRSLLRQDPEVLMIGEIRDAQTAQIVIEAGLTGHLLMSTMHSGTPAGALLRLLEMGIEPYQVTSSVSAVVNQRLLRKLCPGCKQLDKNSGSYTHGQCDKCLHTGFNGRALISEMIQLDSELRKAILAKADLETFAIEGFIMATFEYQALTSAGRLMTGTL